MATPKELRATTCRDCEQCTQTGLKKLGKTTVNVGTLGMAAIGAKMARGFRKTCPVCGHAMADHLTVDGRFQGSVGRPFEQLPRPPA